MGKEALTAFRDIERQVKTEKTLLELHMITAGPVRSRSEGRVNGSRTSSENGGKAFQEAA